MNIKDYIRTIPDFPRKGILYRDITTLLEKPEGLRLAVNSIVKRYREVELDYVAGIEARGFIFGTAVAYELGLGFIPLRKPGKLPGETMGQDYKLEYGEDRIEIHRNVLKSGDRVLLVDDLVATGGTALAAAALIQSTGAIISECCFVIDLPELGGLTRLQTSGYRAFALCKFSGK